jgi:hypothetical protein
VKSWQTFFVVLAFCGIAAALIPWIYHKSQTLTLEELKRHSEIWKATEPTSYTLRVFIDENGTKSTWVFRTEEKKIVAVSNNGHFQPETEGGRFLPESMFKEIGNWLKYKSQDDKQPYITATFNPQLGYPLRAVLRRKSPPQRIEIQMILEPFKH